MKNDMKLFRLLAALLVLTLCFVMASVSHAANCTHDRRGISLIAAPTCTELGVYCAAHQLIAANGKAMVDMTPTADIKKNALTLSRSLWESELEPLYASWVNQSSDEDKAMFSTYLNMQLLMWNRQYGEGTVGTA